MLKPFNTSHLQQMLYRYFPLLVPGLLLLVILFIYFPGTKGDFLFDDLINIAQNPDSYLLSFNLSEIRKVLGSGIASSLGRPLSMLSFGINYYFSGIDAFSYKLTNIVIHLVTTSFVFLLSRELIIVGHKQGLISDLPKNKQFFLALIITAVWALHPLNVSTVLYIVQRMTQLSALFTIAAIFYFCKIRQLEKPSNFKITIHFLFLGLLLLTGVLFKENAILAVPLIILVEIYFFRFHNSCKQQAKFIWLSGTLYFLIPALLALTLLIISPKEIIGDYSIRDFNMLERVLTQTRVLWNYIQWLILPNINDFSFHHDNFSISKNLYTPPSTFFSALGIIGLIGSIPLLFKKLPWLSFGIAFFLCGHMLESSIVALELVFEHRNYLPTTGLILGIVLTLSNIPAKKFHPKLIMIFAFAFILFLSMSTVKEVNKWANPPVHLISMLENNPESHRINYTLAYLFYSRGIQDNDLNAFAIAKEYFLRSAQFSTREIRGHVGVILTNGFLNQTTDPKTLEQMYEIIQGESIQRSIRSQLTLLTDCYYQNHCGTDKSIIIDAYNAVIANTVTLPLVKLTTLGQIADIILYGYGNRDDALVVYYSAQRLTNVATSVDIKIIELELANNNYEAARNHLALARQKEKVFTSADQALDRLEQEINGRQVNPE